MVKWISFIVLTHFFQSNELKILRQPGYLLFLIKPSIFFYSVETYFHIVVRLLLLNLYFINQTYSKHMEYVKKEVAALIS